MKLVEKLLLLFTVLVFSAGAVCVACNRDIYREVDNMHPAKGYADFVSKLSDEDFVLTRYKGWKDSSSWVLQDLYRYLTAESVELNTFSLLFTQAVITFAFYYTCACVPFLVLIFVRVRQRE